MEEASEAQGPGAYVPIGSIIMWAGAASDLSGWLICDGESYDVSAYKELSKAIGRTYTADSVPKDKFSVPDLQGLFVRGVDTVGRYDPDNEARHSPVHPGKPAKGVGSLQNDELKSHDHQYSEPASSEGKRLLWGWSWLVNSGARTGKTGGKETRPKNMYLYYIIKAE